MSFHPMEYAKAHPWATGIIVIVGGIIFISLTGILGGSSSGSAAASGPTDAEVSADAAIQVAQIQAGAAAANYNSQANIANTAANVQLAQIAAAKDVQTNEDNQTASIYSKYIDATTNIQLAGINATTAQQQQIIGSLGSLKKKNRDDVLGELITGTYKPSSNNNGNSASSILGSIFGSGGIGGAISGIGSIFSDQRLKENIVYQGQDPKTGLGLYTYNYKGSKRQYKGYIAQEVAAKYPDKVSNDNKTGYLKVGPTLAPHLSGGPLYTTISPTAHVSI